MDLDTDRRRRHVTHNANKALVGSLLDAHCFPQQGVIPRPTRKAASEGSTGSARFAIYIKQSRPGNKRGWLRHIVTSLSMNAVVLKMIIVQLWSHRCEATGEQRRCHRPFHPQREDAVSGKQRCHCYPQCCAGAQRQSLGRDVAPGWREWIG